MVCMDTAVSMAQQQHGTHLRRSEAAISTDNVKHVDIPHLNFGHHGVNVGPAPVLAVGRGGFAYLRSALHM